MQAQPVTTKFISFPLPRLYTHSRAITLDPATERRLQQQLATGRFRQPVELLADALDLVEAEADITARRTALLARLEDSCAQASRGEGYTEEELRARMAERRAQRSLAKTA